MNRSAHRNAVAWLEIHVADMQRTIDDAGRVFKPKHSIGTNSFIATIGDTEANAIGLHSIK